MEQILGFILLIGFLAAILYAFKQGQSQVNDDQSGIKNVDTSSG